jgi:protoporphyrinogen oxidase
MATNPVALPLAVLNKNMKTRVAILGAGPAGLGAAWQLVRSGKAEAVVLEQRDDVGGNAGSFDLDGVPVDYGSHRLHPACQPNILADLKRLMKNDLLDRPRHGRIYLQGRWIHFPLKPNDFLLRLPFSFSAGVSLDVFRKVVPLSKRNGNGHQETFASVLERGLGTTICRDFYFPYARKIWGAAPEELSAIQARRRVSAGSLGKMARKALGLVPGIKKPGAGRFYYPQQGYGQISRSLSAVATQLGADIRLSTTVREVELGNPHRIEVECHGSSGVIEAQHVWSTVPITMLSRLVNPAPPARVQEAASRITYRAMILIYLVVEQSQWTEFDAHYFPDSDIAITRLSEPKNYSARTEPRDRTVLCAELPCTVDDQTWLSSDEELGRLVQNSLAKCGLDIKGAILNVTTKRLKFAYPIYRQGYEKHFALLDDWSTQLEGVLTFGRQGLFAHDNTHHALAMAYAAVDCLQDSGDFDARRWRDYRTEFAKHVVED